MSGLKPQRKGKKILDGVQGIRQMREIFEEVLNILPLVITLKSSIEVLITQTGRKI